MYESLQQRYVGLEAIDHAIDDHVFTDCSLYDVSGLWKILPLVLVNKIRMSCPTVVRAISTDIICQAIVQHCRTGTSDLELTATCCVKLRLSLSRSLSLSLSLSLATFKSRLKIHLFSTAFC